MPIINNLSILYHSIYPNNNFSSKTDGKTEAILFISASQFVLLLGHFVLN